MFSVKFKTDFRMGDYYSLLTAEGCLDRGKGIIVTTLKVMQVQWFIKAWDINVVHIRFNDNIVTGKIWYIL